MKNLDKIKISFNQLKKLIKESNSDFGYVYLSDLFYKQPSNVPQRTLKKIFKKYDGREPDLDEEVHDWLIEMLDMPKNEWLTQEDVANFITVVWDKDGNGSRGYGITPALKFSTYKSTENCAYILSAYGDKDVGYGETRNWFGRTYP